MATLSFLLDNVHAPKLFVFDLDYTLWPFWCDTHVTRPFTRDKFGRLVDCTGRVVDLYPDVPAILSDIQKRGIQVAAASRTENPPVARELLDLLQVDKYFSYREIYPGRKVKHFERFRACSGLDFSDMIFFDDEYRNIKDVSELNVTCHLVSDGLNYRCIQEALEKFIRKKSDLKGKQQKTLHHYFAKT